MNSDASVYINKSLRLWLTCLMELGICFPLWIVGAEYLMLDLSTTIIWGCGLLVLSFGGMLSRLYFQVMWQRWGISILIGILFGFAIANESWFMLVWVCFSGTFCALQGMTVGTRIHDLKIYVWGFGLYLASGILFPLIDGLIYWIPLLTWMGIATLILTLFMMNEGHIRYSTLSSESAPILPGGLRRHNRIYIVAIVIVAGLLAAGAGKWISGTLWRFVKMVVGWLTRTSPQEPEQIQEEVTDTPQMEPFLPQPLKSPGLISHIFNIIAYVIGTAIIAGLLALLVYWLYKNVGGIWRRSIDSLLSLLRRRGQDEQNTPYRDEEKNIFSWDRLSKKLLDVRRPLTWMGRHTERWEDMNDNKERVRYLYRRLLHSELGAGYELKPHLTPIEQERDFKDWLAQNNSKKTLHRTKSSRGKHDSSSASLIRLYYKVRYGAEQPDDKEVAYIKEKMKI